MQLLTPKPHTNLRSTVLYTITVGHATVWEGYYASEALRQGIYGRYVHTITGVYTLFVCQWQQLYIEGEYKHRQVCIYTIHYAHDSIWKAADECVHITFV